MLMDYARWFHKKAKTKIGQTPWYLRGYADFGNDKIVYDRDVVKYVRDHTRFLDRFNIGKIAMASMWAFSILSGSTEETDFIDKGKFVFHKKNPKGA